MPRGAFVQCLAMVRVASVPHLAARSGDPGTLTRLLRKGPAADIRRTLCSRCCTTYDADLRPDEVK